MTGVLMGSAMPVTRDPPEDASEKARKPTFGYRECVGIFRVPPAHRPQVKHKTCFIESGHKF